ncbi:hypothetical protein HAX54_010754 [Datura stramonium]|uniref:C2 domain-containing protein n=1 Tax=Datura stramonium TaxID=4076 RepID=A0ABS8RIC5_DATST|nr:hypothetical protein [Datura stramonium]
MKVYAKVTVAGRSKYTEVDVVNKKNPEWNATLCFIVPEEYIVRGEIPAYIELFCRRSLSYDKYIGELNLTLSPYYKGECTLLVRRNDDSNRNKSFGSLKFSYELGDKVLVVVSNPSSSSMNYTRIINLLKIGVGVASLMVTTLSS